jgi:hypothetical protein
MSLSRASAQFHRLTKDLGDLVERHERAKGLDSFQRYEDDLPGFAKDYFGVELWSKQLEIWDALQLSPLVSVAGANGTGKDFFSAVALIHHAVCRRGLGILTAATQRQAVEVCMGEVTRLFNRAKDLPGELFRSALRIDGDQACGIVAMASTEASRLTGFHGPRILGVLSEAQGLEPWVLEAFLASAVGEDDRLLAVGNPLFNSGWFFDSSRDPIWEAITIPATEHPNVVEGKVVIPGGPTREWVELVGAKYGTTSSIYRSRVLALPPDQGEESLIPRSHLDRAAAKWPDAMAMIERDRQRGTLTEPVVAIDPARYGPDSTCLCFVRGNTVEEFVVWNGLDTMQTVDRAVDEMRKHGFRPYSNYAPAFGAVVVDTIGIGSGVADRFRQLGYTVEGFNAGAPPMTEKEQFLNKRAASYWNLKTMLEEDRIVLPPDEKLFGELLAITWKPTADGKIQLEPKDQLKGRLGRSPDRADACSMAFYEPHGPQTWIGNYQLTYGGITFENLQEWS